jgi:hypothetical protein
MSMSKRTINRRNKHLNRILEALSTGEATSPELAAALEADLHQIQNAITRLRDKGLVESISTNGRRLHKWRLVAPVAKSVASKSQPAKAAAPATVPNRIAASDLVDYVATGVVARKVWP